MKICYQTSNLFERIEWDTALRWIAEAGFDAVDYSMFFLNKPGNPLRDDDPKEHAEKVLPLVQKNGLHVHQGHAPFPSNIPGNEEYNKTILDDIRKSLEIAGHLGIGQVVVHPFKAEGGREAVKEANIRFYNSLADTARKAHVRIAIENVWDWDPVKNRIVPLGPANAEELADLYDALDPEVFTICLDIGHCSLVGEKPDEVIRTLGHDRLGALHVHDNDGKSDLHMLPYSANCNIDWKAITDALGEIDYTGYFTLEADVFISRGTPAVVPAMLEYSAKISRILSDDADKARKR